MTEWIGFMLVISGFLMVLYGYWVIMFSAECEDEDLPWAEEIPQPNKPNPKTNIEPRKQLK